MCQQRPFGRSAGKSSGLSPLKRIFKFDLLFTDLTYLQEIDKQECATGAEPPSENPAMGAPQVPGVSETRAGPPEDQGEAELVASAMRSPSGSSSCNTISSSDLGEDFLRMREWCFSSEESQSSPDPGAKRGPAPRILYSTLGHAERSVKVKSRRKEKKKVTFKDPVYSVEGVSTAVQRVTLQETPAAQPSNTESTTTSERSGLNGDSVVHMSVDTGAPSSSHTVEQMEVEAGRSNGANMEDSSIRAARMAALRAELRALQTLDREEAAKAKAEKRAANAELVRKQIAVFHQRQTEGLAHRGKSDYKVDPEWPNYNRKDRRLVIRKTELHSFFLDLGVPVELSSKLSWGSLSNVYGALMVGLFGAGWLDGIDQRLDKDYFHLCKSMRQVHSYIEYVAPALVDGMKEARKSGYASLLGGKYLTRRHLVSLPLVPRGREG